MRISQEGTFFTNAFCTTSSLELGIDSLLHGIHFQPNTLTGELVKDIPSLQSIFKKRGYRTAFFGVWSQKIPPKDFEYWEIQTTESLSYNPEFISPDGSRKIEGHISDIIADITLDWMKNHLTHAHPNFIVVQFPGARRPWVPPIRHLSFLNDIVLPEPETLRSEKTSRAPPSRYQAVEIQFDLSETKDLFLEDSFGGNMKSKEESGHKLFSRMNGEQLSAWQLSIRPQNQALARAKLEMEDNISWKYQRFAKNYLRCIHAVDENVGRLYDFAESNQTDGTWNFVYTACKGSFLGENGWFGDGWMYEPVMRIPLILSGKNFQDRSINESYVQLIDLFPTLTNSKNENVHGLNFNSDLTHNSKERFLHFEHHHFPDERMVAKHYGIRGEKYKLIHYHQFDEWELFDLENDPLEQTNLYDDTLDSSIREKHKIQLMEKRKFLGFQSFSNPMPVEWRKIYRGPNARKKELIEILE